MRRSPLKHSLAVLRQITGLGQKEFADLVGKSPRTIQAIELGKLPLSEPLGVAIMNETGISYQWLMAGDADATPRARRGGRPYTKREFEQTRARRIDDWPKAKKEEWGERVKLGWGSCFNLMRALASAAEAGQFQVASYRVQRLVESLRAEFGMNNDALTKYLRNCKLKLTDPDGKTIELILVNDLTTEELDAAEENDS